MRAVLSPAYSVSGGFQGVAMQFFLCYLAHYYAVARVGCWWGVAKWLQRCFALKMVGRCYAFA